MWGDIQDIFLFGCPKTIDITGFFKKFCIATRTTELLAAAEMLSSLLRERELAVHCIDEVFKAVADLPQHPADAYFSILRFRKETGRHKTLI